MAEFFVELDSATQGEIIQALAPKLGRAPSVLEKDVWLCWALDALFTMPDRVRMAFKGGTSLSKVYGAIHRFSEDVDITLDYRALAPQADPFVPGISKSQMKRIAADLKERVKDHTFNVVVPYLEGIVREQRGGNKTRVEHDAAGEKIWLHYDSVIADRAAYMADSILIEFGGRNITEPSETHALAPFIEPFVQDLEFPHATVEVLSPARTFWEKATLIHAECNRGTFKATTERLSRHWYDLALLAENEIGERAIADLALLQNVVDHKRTFFYVAHAKYLDCTGGKMQLVPDEPMARELKKDYQAMIDAGMFDVSPPSFNEILASLNDLATHVNDLCR